MKNHMKELTEGMQRLCAVANRIGAQQDKVSRIDVDLLLEDLRRLYDVALQLEPEASKKEVRSEKLEAEEQNDMAVVLTMAAMQPEPQNQTSEKDEQVKAQEPVVEPEPVIAPEPEVEPAPAEPEPVVMPQMEDLEQNDNALLFDEVIIEPEVPKQSESQDPPVTQENPRKAEPPVSGQASLLDYLNQPVQRTLGESLVGQVNTDLSSLNTQKVDDLRSVININDKFSFMSELFHNNMKAYNDFIMSLNAMADRDEALEYVRNMAAQQKWDEDSATVQAFYRIFDKKF